MRRSPMSFPAILGLLVPCAVMANGGGPMSPGGGSMGGRQGMGQGEEIQSQPSVDKPDVAALKAYNAGVKTLGKAKEYEADAQKAPNADKKAKALAKENDALNLALDQFTVALMGKSDMYEAWNYAGYVHRRLGAYAESLDDYNHALALKPDYLPAIEYRGEAFLGLDRIGDAKIAYMDLFNHARNLADQLMAAMQQWLADRRQSARGVSGADLDAFEQWVKERDGIAKQTASLGVSVPVKDWK